MRYLTRASEVAGLAGLSYGSWLYSHPLGFIVGGLCLVAIGQVKGGGK
jgi:hypothetical protein